jgi:hypothetical protein
MIELNLCNLVLPSCFNPSQTMVFCPRMCRILEEMTKQQRAEIVGSPGTGKSTIRWLYVTLYQKFLPHRVITWVNLQMSIRIVIYNHKYFVTEPL